MKTSVIRIFLLLQVLQVVAFAGNSVVNLSHYDLMRVDFARMKAEGIIGVIHEATYPPSVRDAYYGTRQNAATRAGLLWGAYHFAMRPTPFVRPSFSSYRGVATAGTVTASQRGLARPRLRKEWALSRRDNASRSAVTFVERIRQRTGKYPGLYGSEYRLRQVLHAPKVTAAQRRILSNCWLWIANYHHVPRDTAPWSHWTMWQYTGDGVCDLPRASYPKGIANIKHAERNMFRGNAAAAQAFWQEHAWKPAN